MYLASATMFKQYDMMGKGLIVLGIILGILLICSIAFTVYNALTVLGFTAGEASQAVGRLDSALPVEVLVREALKMLARRG